MPCQGFGRMGNLLGYLLSTRGFSRFNSFFNDKILFFNRDFTYTFQICKCTAKNSLEYIHKSYLSYYLFFSR